MDPEVVRQLTEAVENLTNVMYNAGGKLSGLGDAANKANFLHNDTVLYILSIISSTFIPSNALFVILRLPTRTSAIFSCTK